MSYASFVHRFARFNWRFGRVFIPFWIALVGLLTIAAAADSIWDFGWGYRWQDVLLGLGMMAGGVVFWFAFIWMFKLMRWLNELFFGPDPQGDIDLRG